MTAAMYTSGAAAGSLGEQHMSTGAGAGSFSPAASCLTTSPGTPQCHAPGSLAKPMGCMSDGMGKQQRRRAGRPGRLQPVQRHAHQRRCQQCPLAGAGDSCTAFEALLAAAEACQASLRQAGSFRKVANSVGADGSSTFGESSQRPGGEEEDSDMLG